MGEYPGRDYLMYSLPFRLAGRLDDDLRDQLGSDAAHGVIELIVPAIAGAALFDGVPLTADERDLVREGLQWLDKPVDKLDPLPVLSETAVDNYLLRWRFLPASPASDAIEMAAISKAGETPGATALLTAWREGPDGIRVRAYCVVCSPRANIDRTWFMIERAMEEPLGGRHLPSVGVVLEAVQEGAIWGTYQRRMVEASTVVWQSRLRRLDLEGQLRDQPQRLELVELDDERAYFPGLSDRDAVDQTAMAWASAQPRVRALVRCWSQAAQGEKPRLRVFAVVVETGADVDQMRESGLGAIGQAMGGSVALEVIDAEGRPRGHQRRILDHGVLLWERNGPAS